MKARTEIEVGLDGRGRTIVTTMRCEAPLLFRIGGSAGDALLLLMVGGAAGPIGGDDLQMRVHLGAGTSVIVRSVGATMVQPGAGGRPSTADVHITMDQRARLDWLPEPLVSVIGSDHRSMTTLELGPACWLRWIDEVSLGRFDEQSGRLAVRQRLEVEGRVVLDHETQYGTDALRGPGAHGRGRCIASELIVADDAPTVVASLVSPDVVRATFPLADRAALTTCIATDRHDPAFRAGSDLSSVQRSSSPQVV